MTGSRRRSDGHKFNNQFESFKLETESVAESDSFPSDQATFYCMYTVKATLSSCVFLVSVKLILKTIAYIIWQRQRPLSVNLENLLTLVCA